MEKGINELYCSMIPPGERSAEGVFLCSIAVSLRRIADAIEADARAVDDANTRDRP